MLARAVSAQAGPHVGFLRADAQQLPLRDETVDAAVSIAVLQLIPNPAATLAEIARVLRPGGRMAVMVPTAGACWPRCSRLLPDGGAHFFAEDELGDTARGPRPRRRADEDCRHLPMGARETTVTHVDSSREHRRHRPCSARHRRRAGRHRRPTAAGHAAGVRRDRGVGRLREQRHRLGDARRGDRVAGGAPR